MYIIYYRSMATCLYKCITLSPATDIPVRHDLSNTCTCIIILYLMTEPVSLTMFTRYKVNSIVCADVHVHSCISLL